MTEPGPSSRAADVVRDYLGKQDFEWDEVGSGVFSLSLPGERKLSTPVRLEAGTHSFIIQAFVCRKPDENHEAVYRWLLDKNLKMYAVGFAVDHLGDIYLVGRLPLRSITSEELDTLLGAVLTYADESFNTLLELGFASSIRREYEWRISRGEPTHNLDAFKGWLQR